MINTRAIPFLKILIPYVIGIISVNYINELNHFHLPFIVSVICAIILFFFQKGISSNTHYKKVLYIVSINVFLFLLAFESVYIYNDKNNSDHYAKHVSLNKQSAFVHITDVPVETENFIKLYVTVNAISENNCWKYAIGKTIIYVRKPSDANFNVGDQLLVNSKFTSIQEPKNPHEFNYKSYLAKQNIFHVVYTNHNEIIKTPSINSGFYLAEIGSSLKSKTISVLKHSGLSKKAFAISSALLVGYDDEIDDDVMAGFSHSGTLHVLSVSGMHTGILYGVIVFLFSAFDKHNQYKKLKCFISILLLFLFVLITGFAPAVLRAALMLSLILIGQTFRRQGNSYNTLLLSAFIVLLVNPYLIYDIGFLLSYLAVFGIMYLYPLLNNLYFFENRLLRWSWELSMMSVAATLFTLPVTLYVFHQFPTWFVFSNLVIIPISTIIMFGAIILVLIYKVTFLSGILCFIINNLVDIMIWFANLSNHKYGYIDFISFSWVDAVFMALLILMMIYIINSKSYKSIFQTSVLCAMWLLYILFDSYNQAQTKEFIIFHVKNKSLLVLREANKVYGDFENLTHKEFNRSVKPYLQTIRDVDTINEKISHFNYSHLNVVSSLNTNLLNATLVVVSSDNFPEFNRIPFKNKPLVVADCSNSSKFVNQLKKHCKELGFNFYSVKHQGAFYSTLNP